MNPLNKININNNNPTATPSENLINKVIPIDLLKVTFSNLEDPKDVQSTVCACKSWQKINIDLAFQKEVKSRKEFLEFLQHSLAKENFSISDNDTVLLMELLDQIESGNLIAIKSSINKIDRTLYEVLKRD